MVLTAYAKASSSYSNMSQFRGRFLASDRTIVVENGIRPQEKPERLLHPALAPHDTESARARASLHLWNWWKGNGLILTFAFVASTLQIDGRFTPKLTDWIERASRGKRNTFFIETCTR